jgi:hypothetical protein
MRLSHAGERMREACSINKSLSALSDVISARVSKRPHVPYRNSKLTMLLHDSLSGHSKCMMYCAVSSADVDFAETMCTLNFAQRVMHVENGAVKKVTTLTGSETKRLQDDVDALRVDISKLAAEKSMLVNELSGHKQAMRNESRCAL